jgi:hypothetical protein
VIVEIARSSTAQPIEGVTTCGGVSDGAGVPPTSRTSFRRYRAEHGERPSVRRRELYRAQRERQTTHDAAPKPGPFSRVAEGQASLRPPPSSNRTCGFPASGFT